MNLAVLILHFADPKKTLACLSSIDKADKKGLLVKIFLIDNGTGTKFAKNKNIEFIRNSRNLGFAKGINRGLLKALKNKNTDYFLILNNDTRLPRDFFQKIKETSFAVSGVVIKFKSEKGEWIYDYGGKINPWTAKTEHFEYKRLIKKYIPSNQDYFSGCCLLIKREVFAKIGLFDERYFFYYEDVDFCLSARNAGFNLGLVQDSVIFHELSSSIGRWSNKAIFENLKSRLKFINKNLGLRKPVAWIFLILLTIKIIRDKIIKA